MTKVKCSYCGNVDTEQSWMEQTVDYIKETRGKTVSVEELKPIVDIVKLDKWKRTAYMVNCPECRQNNNGDEVTVVE